MKFCIWVNHFDSDTRKNFTVAHEIGHYVYDILADPEKYKNSSITDDFNSLKRDGSINLIEKRANNFAAMLLMPKDHLSEVWVIH